MRQFIKLGLAGLVIVVAGPAVAANYCWVSHIHGCMGCTVDATMETVVSTYPRPKPPARDAGPWCGVLFRSLSAFYKPMAVTERPKFGTVGVNKYGFGYQSKKPGKDSFTVQTFQLNGQDSKPTNVTIHVDVTVDAAPF